MIFDLGGTYRRAGMPVGPAGKDACAGLVNIRLEAEVKADVSNLALIHLEVQAGCGSEVIVYGDVDLKVLELGSVEFPPDVGKAAGHAGFARFERRGSGH